MVAKRKEETSTNGNGKGKIKFRYTDEERTVQFSMENIASESVVTEGLRGLANALAGRNITDPARRLQKAVGGTPSAVENEEEELETPEQATAEEEEVEAPEDAANGNGVERRRRAAPRAPKFLSELNLTAAPVQLEGFVKEKNPDGDMEKYAVIAAWFKEHFSTDEINIDHIFTAYKKLGWQAQLPPDPSQTFRNLKNNKNWFDSGSKRGDYKINWNGVDAVNKMGVISA